MDADVKLLVEFLDAVRRDAPKDAFSVSSLDTSPPSTRELDIRICSECLLFPSAREP